MKISLLTFSVLPLAIMVTLSSAKINPNNPPVGRTGAPGETTCQASGCHAGGSFTGAVTLTGLPDTIVAAESYILTLTNTSNAIRAGFQLTVLDENNAKAGNLTAGTGTSIGNGGGRQYVRQSSPRTLMNGATSWTFTWQAPTAVVQDSIHFYFASLCANGNGQTSGDNALKNRVSAVMPAVVSATNNREDNYSLKIFPNPSNDFLMVEVPGKGELILMDSNGKTVQKIQIDRSARLSISALQSGFYFVKFRSGDRMQINSFVKK